MSWWCIWNSILIFAETVITELLEIGYMKARGSLHTYVCAYPSIITNQMQTKVAPASLSSSDIFPAWALTSLPFRAAGTALSARVSDWHIKFGGENLNLIELCCTGVGLSACLNLCSATVRIQVLFCACNRTSRTMIIAVFCPVISLWYCFYI